MRFVNKDGLCFDDVLLVPQHSDIPSRLDVSTKTRLGGLDLDIPILSANMDTITGPKMAKAMRTLGGYGILHRFIQDMDVHVANVGSSWSDVIPSIGIKKVDLHLAAQYLEYGARAICVDVAHGDHVTVANTIRSLVSMGWRDVIAGNVATGAGARTLLDAGANIIKIGIGPGAMCTTRTVTGHGIPQLSAVMDCVKMRDYYTQATFIADGGIKSSGDIVKALAAGADAVMLGSLLAGTDECPMPGVYRGMASHEAQIDYKGSISNGAPEGAAIMVSPKGPVDAIINNLVGGIRSGLSYSGVYDIKGLQREALFMRVSGNTLQENAVRGIL